MSDPTQPESKHQVSIGKEIVMSPHAVTAVCIALLVSTSPRYAIGQAVTNYVAGLDTPFGLEFDPAGNLYVSSSAGSYIYKVGPGGSPVSILTAQINNPGGLALDAGGILHVADSIDGLVWRVHATTGAKTLLASGLALPLMVAFDAAGDLYVSELLSGTVKRITPAGTVSDYVTGLDPGGNGTSGLVFGSDGSLYVGVGSTILRVGAGGSPVTVFATGLAHAADLARSPGGEWYASTYLERTVMSVPATGGSATLYAGQPSASACVNGTLLDARFGSPYGTRIRGGDLYVADNGCNSVRMVDLSSATPASVSSWGRVKAAYR